MIIYSCNNSLFKLFHTEKKDLFPILKFGFCVPKFDTPPSSLMDSTRSPKVKTSKEEGVGVRSLARSTLGVEGRAGAPGWD